MDFSELFGLYLSRSVLSYGQIATLSGVPKRTLANWAKGIVRRPRDWHALLKVAAALHLTTEEADALLVAADHERLADLAAKHADASTRRLFAHWTQILPLQPDAALLWRYLIRQREELTRLPAYFPQDINITFDLISQDVRLAPFVRGVHESSTASPRLEAQMWSALRQSLRRVVLAGLSGSGKSWLLKLEAVREIDEAGDPGEGLPARLPIYLELPSLATALAGQPGLEHMLQTIATLAARRTPDLPERPLAEAILAYLRAYPTRGTLLLDALDEVPARDGLRGTARYAILQLGRGTELAIWLTMRLQNYAMESLAPYLGTDVAELELQPFTDVEIGRVVRAWYHGRPEQFSELQRTMRRAPALIRQGANPLLLSMITMVGDVEPAALRGSRTHLLERVMVLMLEGGWRAYEMRVPESRVERKLRLLERIAWTFATYGGQWNEQIPGDVLETAIEALPVTSLLRKTWRAEWDAVYEGPLWELSERDGILIKEYLPCDGASSIVPFRFLQRTFHEILVGRYLVRRFLEAGSEAPEIQAYFTQYLKEFEWYRVLMFLSERLLFEQAAATAPLAAKLASAILSGGPDPSGQLALAAAEMVCMVGVDQFAPDNVQALRDRLGMVMRSRETPAILWPFAGRLLGEIGDPRPYVMDVDAIDFVDVPAGPFLMGSDPTVDKSAGADELPQRSVTLPAFRMARFPVSNAHYRAFLAAPDGFDNPDNWIEAIAAGCWRDGKVLRQMRVFRPDGRWDIEAQWLREPSWSGWPANNDNHPITAVNWYEARAFVRWLDARYRRMGRLGPQDRLDLPSEAEWEKAARGVDGRIHPWGNDFVEENLNWRGRMLMASMPIGSYPFSGSPYGVEEMLGNLWEWTRSLYAPYGDGEGPEVTPEMPCDAGVVLRGGAYFEPACTCRCAARQSGPVYGFTSSTFRVVWRMDVGT